MAEDEGFEPPQTESESGVLPLHKSSIWNGFIIRKISEKSSSIFHFLLQFFIFPNQPAFPVKLPALNSEKSLFLPFLQALLKCIAVLPGSGDAFCLFPDLG